MGKSKKGGEVIPEIGTLPPISNSPQVGDIILVHGGSFLAKGIQFFMNIYRSKQDLAKRKLYNHVAVVIDLYGQKYIAEAVAKGVQVIPDADKYVATRDCTVLTWVNPLTAKEKAELSREAAKYALEIHRYDVLNFPYQIKYIMTGKWRGPTGDKAERRIYCSELAAIVMDKIRGSFDGQTWDKNPLDIELSPDLKVLSED